MAGQKNVVLLFHIYQPPWQTAEAFEAEYQNSYLPLLKVVKAQKIKITLNICGSLVEFLERQQKTEFKDLLQELLAAKLIELTGSAMYHALLPLTPADEVARQIQLNTEALKRYLGHDLKLSGFYIPELAADTATLQHIKKAGFSWAAIDESSLLHPDWQKAMIDDDSGIILLANDAVFRTDGAAKFERPYNVLISDGEHQTTDDKKDIAWVRYIREHQDVSAYTFLTASEYLDSIKNNPQYTAIQASNWQINSADRKAGKSFALWDDPDNELHQSLWAFIKAVKTTADAHRKDAHFSFVQGQLDRAYSSCTWWWADGRVLGYNPTNIEQGLGYMINAVRSLDTLPTKERLDFEQKHADLVYKIWQKHWQRG